MAKKTDTTKKTYRQLRDELDAALVALQDPERDVDEAADAYQRALTLVKEIEAHLQSTENRIEKIKADFGR